MHSVLIVIHLFVAVGLVTLILLQRSEGGALGMGGGPGGIMSGRAAGNMLTRATTWLAVLFFITSITLTIFTGARSEGGGGVLERLESGRGAATAPAGGLGGAAAPAPPAATAPVPDDQAEPASPPPPADAPRTPAIPPEN